MDYIWTPWRYQYITNAIAGEKPECIFCDAAKRTDDPTTLVVHRGVSSFAILNRFPYTSGHLMIVPYKHTAEISGVDAATLTEMMHLAQRTEAAFKSLYDRDSCDTLWRNPGEPHLNLALTDDQLLLQKSVREFAESEVTPLARENDEKGHFPRALFAKAAELGLTGVALPESEGGAGFDH